MRLEKLLSYIIPHPKTHEKAKLLSWQFLFIYFLLFAILRVGFDVVNIYKPGVLGISSEISVQKVIDDTNIERQKAGLPALVENSVLDEAAKAKAANMFTENYWAHYSPSGKDPWGFIKSAGYNFSYAGENLARNFYNSDDVVKAWMNSPSHKENLLNSHYQEIGIAVVEGTLQGQQTTLVVQMFGRPSQGIAAVPLPSPALQGVSTKAVELPNSVVVQKPLFDPGIVTRNAGMFLVLMITSLLLADLIILKRREVFRLSSHHIAHFGFLAVMGASIILSKAGEIL